MTFRTNLKQFLTGLEVRAAPFTLVGRTPSSARDALVPPKPARGPAAVQGDRPTH
jgi:hypothetical protein